ncbi:helix-turn-helix transcriptional regulator [Gottfriedia acidiceleris]|uniref:Helix-turn-helix transcriptional regulator n=1 Tax=Gottfriedia acidiceleris TaxID=371036 RepID=A0ABY4JJE2_9BACI|nr:helix-turn-helix transcriptional regulator [Gottfriedia acidiceleris]UPM52445.1 helix-turn-helix transcriptional regulator [Gottfriedia acidiceleris]
MELSETIRRIREELGITQENLAHSVYVSFSTVNRWENKKSAPNRVTIAMLVDFCEKQGVSNKLIEELRKCK